jgi:hypothetical protein
LVKQLDERLRSAAGKTENPLGAYVIFDNASAGFDGRLRALARREGLAEVTLSIGAAPPKYEVSSAADITVVIYTVGRRSQQHVTANFALRQSDLTDAKAAEIVRALSDVLPR